jgi:nitroimidazol reductase NimA-like FMN-containing flavoprotein (pyridoxamine 5'-phosphate oxidase superfamily)
LVDGDEPYVIAMNFGYNDKALYLYCAPEGRKTDLIRKNNKVCVAFETGVQMLATQEPCRLSEKYRIVVGVRKAQVLSSEQEKTRVLRPLTVIIK